MGYMHIDNLYREQTILERDFIYALEKLDGTSSRILFTRSVTDYVDNLNKKTTGNFHYHGGGITGEQFKALFNTAELEPKLSALPGDKITIYGESYGGKLQGKAASYGPDIKFCAFDVKVDDRWLTVPEAEALVLSLGIEFVHYVRIPTKLSEIDFWRDATSEQAIRNGVTTRDGQWIRREGVVLRTLDEVADRRGNRIIAKHKRDEERETKTLRVVDPTKVAFIKEARRVAEEFVTKTRLDHVLQKIPGEPIVDMTRTREVISAMIEDINREGDGEFEPSNTVNAEIGKRTAQLLKQYFVDKLKESHVS
jgi:hypothetical protein